MRLDSLDVLRTRAADSPFAAPSSAAARLDRNPGVRIKALDALQGFEQDPAVRDALWNGARERRQFRRARRSDPTLFAALQSEGGSGGSDSQTVAVLRDRLRNDPSPIVRQQSAAALSALGVQ